MQHKLPCAQPESWAGVWDPASLPFPLGKPSSSSAGMAGEINISHRELQTFGEARQEWQEGANPAQGGREFPAPSPASPCCLCIQGSRWCRTSSPRDFSALSWEKVLEAALDVPKAWMQRLGGKAEGLGKAAQLARLLAEPGALPVARTPRSHRSPPGRPSPGSFSSNYIQPYFGITP